MKNKNKDIIIKNSGSQLIMLTNPLVTTDAISSSKYGFPIHFSSVSRITVNFGLLLRSLLQQLNIKSWTTFGQL